MRKAFPGSLLAAAALLLAACSEAGPAAPLAPTTEALRSSSTASATLIECSTDVTVVASDTIDLLGGTVRVTDAVGGVHEVVFPANAVLEPTIFTLTVPASKYVEVDVTAQSALTGAVQSLTFPVDAQPTLAISYKRCERSNVENQALQLFNIDESTNAVLEGPFGTKEENPDDPRVKGKVPHFSDYAIGST